MNEPTIDLANGALRARVARRGAELVALEHRGRPLLWSGDPAIWDRRAPLLFPVVGRSPEGHVAVDGRAWPMPAHGFARDRDFAVLGRDERSVTLVLEADAATREHYPFRFRLAIDVVAEETALAFEARIENADTRPMPFGFGYHPGFLWSTDPAERSRCVLRFEAEEDGPVRRADLGTGLLLPERETSPLDGRTLRLEDRLFERGSIQFERVRSRAVWFGPDGGEGLRVEFPDSPQLGVWTKPGAPFLCIEPWQGLAAEADGLPDLAARPGTRVLAPGETARYRMRVALGVPDPGR